MNTAFDPLAVDNADDFITLAMRRLGRGVHDRRHPFRIIALASTGLDGTPQLRSVVLRGCDAASPTITFHTDTRSPKFAELKGSPQAAALAYDPAAKLQIRLTGTVSLHHNNAEAAEIWGRMQPTSRTCYHTGDAPSGLPTAAPLLSEAQAQANFCVCRLNISQIDALYLRAAGHLRAQANYPASGHTAYWVAP
jgi:pyridoxine/pyridoxamine 5'-phosphate oxidase